MIKEPYVAIERSIIKQFRKEIWRPFVKGLQAYEMIADGDRIAVCISGGKDSMLLAKCMQELKRHSKTNFELEFIVMDPGYNPANRRLIEENAALMNIPVQIDPIAVDALRQAGLACRRRIGDGFQGGFPVEGILVAERVQYQVAGGVVGILQVKIRCDEGHGAFQQLRGDADDTLPFSLVVEQLLGKPFHGL